MKFGRCAEAIDLSNQKLYERTVPAWLNDELDTVVNDRG